MRYVNFDQSPDERRYKYLFLRGIGADVPSARKYRDWRIRGLLSRIKAILGIELSADDKERVKRNVRRIRRNARARERQAVQPLT